MLVNERPYSKDPFASLSRKSSIKREKISLDKLTHYLQNSRKDFKLNELQKETSSVLVVGYPDGTPKGLHIFPGNKSPEVMSLSPTLLQLGAGYQTSQISKLIRDQKYARNLDGLRLNSEERPSSPGGKIKSGHRETHNNSPGSRKRRASMDQGKSSYPRQNFTSGESKIVAPWREQGPFQSAEQRRRRTYDTFKMMSFDPPPALTNTLPKSTLQSNQKKPSEYYNQVIRITNFNPNTSWNHSRSFYNGPWSSAVGSREEFRPTRQHSRGASQGKSFTGLSLKDPRLANLKGTTMHHTASQGFFGNRHPKRLNQKVTTTVLATKHSVSSFKSTNPFQQPSPQSNASSSPADSTVPDRWSTSINPNHIIRSNQIQSSVKKEEQSKAEQNVVHAFNTSPLKSTQRNANLEAHLIVSSNRLPQSQLHSSRSPRQQASSAHLSVPGNDAPASPSNLASPPPKITPPTWKREKIYIGHYNASDSEPESEKNTGATKETSSTQLTAA